MRNTTILFDIDQTLLYSGGAGSRAMRQAFAQLYGIEDGFKRVEFSGRTDWSILRNAMQQHGLLDGHDEGHFRQEMARFQERYYELLPVALRQAEGGHAMPGVSELLDALSEHSEARLGLATGNFRRAASLKLSHFALDRHLTEGGFGDDAEDRGALVGKAIERVSGSDAGTVWVIGDTPLDVQAAQANNARALGVATGPCTVAELLAVGASAALEDLSDTAAVLETLFGG
ncbi:MAG: HAD hydrolase-like protein [Dehalococcoidia bacterium]